MSENDTDAAGDDSSPESLSVAELVETAESHRETASDHRERADEYIQRAEERVKEAVEDVYDTTATVTAKNGGEVFAVGLRPKESLADVFDRLDDDGEEWDGQASFTVRLRRGADIVHTGSSRRDQIKNLKALISSIEEQHEQGAPIDEVKTDAFVQLGLSDAKIEDELESLRRKGEVYEPRTGFLRTT